MASKEQGTGEGGLTKAPDRPEGRRAMGGGRGLGPGGDCVCPNFPS